MLLNLLYRHYSQIIFHNRIVDLNECDEDNVDDQCKHGSCRNTQFSYTCECYDGYKGDKCDVENDKDQANGMINNGYMFFNLVVFKIK